jgi:hypothetical protein
MPAFPGRCASPRCSDTGQSRCHGNEQRIPSFVPAPEASLWPIRGVFLNRRSRSGCSQRTRLCRATYIWRPGTRIVHTNAPERTIFTAVPAGMAEDRPKTGTGPTRACADPSIRQIPAERPLGARNLSPAVPRPTDRAESRICTHLRPVRWITSYLRRCHARISTRSSCIW